MDKLKKLIEEGILLEEEFILLYMKVIKDEGFIQYFPNQNKAKELLQTLIDQSTWHQDTLNKIKEKL